MKYILFFIIIGVNTLFASFGIDKIYIYSYNSVYGEIEFMKLDGTLSTDKLKGGVFLESRYNFFTKSSFLLNTHIKVNSKDVFSLQKAYFKTSFFDDNLKIRIGRDIKDFSYTRFYDVLDFYNSNINNFTLYDKNLKAKSLYGMSAFMINPINKKQNITIHSYIDDITSKETDMIELIDNTSKGKKSIFISNKEDEPLSFCLAKKTIVNSKIIQTSVIKYQNNNTKFLDNLYSVSSIEYTNKNLMVGFEYTTLGKLTTNNKKSETSNMYISGYLKYNNFSNFKALASHLLNISDFSSKAILEIEYKYKVLNFNLKHIVYNGDVNTQFGDIKTNKFADKVQFLVYSSFKF
jgi:hypothetical protein